MFFFCKGHIVIACNYTLGEACNLQTLFFSKASVGIRVVRY